jgi:site-specific DNA recombinase
MSKSGSVAFYARVSSEAQAHAHTIDSQIAALKERIAADGFELEPDHGYTDDGWSGTNLQRPALEKLRDAVAGGEVERIYVHAPDRLARRHAHQVVLIEEFRRSGAEIVFLNRAISDTAEDELLLQVQGIIAEYERTKILERARRGRRHAARCGAVSALTGAPFGYRYISCSQGGGVARLEIVDDEARIVRSIFGWIGLDRLSLRDVCRRLQQMGCKSPRGLRHWSATTVRSMLGNPAYIGRAVLGRSRIIAAGPRPCLLRRNSPPVPSATRRVAGPREEWIEIAVPALIELAMFEAAQAQLAENRKRKRYSQSGPRWLLQGLTVCRCCGYAYCATVPWRTDRLRHRHHYYRCLSMKEHGFNGVVECGNPSVRGDRLEQAVWEQVRALLEDPRRVADEYRRRIRQANGEAGPLEQVARVERQIATVQRAIDRLIDCYAGGFIEKAEFEPRIAGLKLRRSQLQDQRRAAVTAANSERELSLVISRLEDFSAKVTDGLDGLDWPDMREIIHAVVRRIEIDRDSIEVVFRVPPKGGPSRGEVESPRQGILQDCTNAQARNRGRYARSAVPLAQLWGFERRTCRVSASARREVERLRRAKHAGGFALIASGPEKRGSSDRLSDEQRICAS